MKGNAVGNRLQERGQSTGSGLYYVTEVTQYDLLCKLWVHQ